MSGVLSLANEHQGSLHRPFSSLYAGVILCPVIHVLCARVNYGPFK